MGNPGGERRRSQPDAALSEASEGCRNGKKQHPDDSPEHWIKWKIEPLGSNHPQDD
jgi:hypothetical protein